MGAAFHYFSFIEHADFVGVLDGGKAVGDGNGGAGLHEPFERFLHEAFAFGVECRGGFVEDEDGRILEDGAGDGDALALSAGEAAAAVAHLGVVAFLAFHDEVVGIGDFRRFDDLLHRGVFHAEGNVVEETVVEEDGLLVDVANHGAEVGKVDALHVGAVDENLAFGHVVIAGQEVDEGRLARTALPHQCDGLSALHGEIDAVEHLGAAVVAEGDVAEFDFMLQLLEVNGVLHFADGVVGQENLVDALHRRHTLGNGIGGFREILERLYDAVEDDHVEDKGGGIHGRMFREDEGAAIPQHEHDEAGAEKFADGVGQGLAHGHAVGGLAEFVGALVEALVHLLFSREGLDDAHAAEGFFQLGHGFAPFVLGVEALAFQLAADAPHDGAHEGQHDDGEEREFPADVDEHAEIADEEDGVFDEHFERAGHGGFDFVDVAAHAGDDVAFALVGEETQGESDDFVVDAGADVAHDAGAHRHNHGSRKEVGTRLEEGGRNEEDADEQQGGRSAVVGHELLRVEIHVIDEKVLQAVARRIPGDEVVDGGVDLEEQVEHRDEGGEREHVEHGRQQVEEDGAEEVVLVWGDVTPHHFEKILHNQRGGGRGCFISVRSRRALRPTVRFPISAGGSPWYFRAAISRPVR